MTDTQAAPSKHSYLYAISVIIGASEVYNLASGPTGAIKAPLSYDAQVNLTARLFADASPQIAVSRAQLVLPLCTPNLATYRKFAKPTAPVLIMVSTQDPNTPHALGKWFADGLGPNATLVTVPYSAHGTVSRDAPCANSIAFGFLLGFGSMPDMSCLADIPVPDFEGEAPEVQALSQEFFGTSVLWNDGPPIVAPGPGSPATS